MIRLGKVTTVLSLSLLLATASLYAKSESDVVLHTEQTKNAAKLLKDSYAYLGTLQKYAFHATVINRLVDGGEHIEMKRVSDVKVKRPDQFRIDTKSDYVDRTFYLSNGVFTMIDNDEKYYASVKTNTDIDKTLDRLNKKLGIVLPLSTLLHSDMAKFIHPKRVQYFGTVKVGGVDCNYIAFKQGKTTVHLWIENSDRPLIQSAKIITDNKSAKGTTDMVIKWAKNANFSDTVFIFKAPKNAMKIDIKPAK